MTILILDVKALYLGEWKSTNEEIIRYPRRWPDIHVNLHTRFTSEYFHVLQTKAGTP